MIKREWKFGPHVRILSIFYKRRTFIFITFSATLWLNPAQLSNWWREAKYPGKTTTLSASNWKLSHMLGLNLNPMLRGSDNYVTNALDHSAMGVCPFTKSLIINSFLIRCHKFALDKWKLWKLSSEILVQTLTETIKHTKMVLDTLFSKIWNRPLGRFLNHVRANYKT